MPLNFIHVLFLGVLLLWAGKLIGSNSRESTIRQIDKTSIDSIQLYIEKIKRNQPEEARQLTLMALKQSEEIGYTIGVGQAYEQLGFIHQIRSQYPEALEMYQRGLEVYSKNALPNKKASIYNQIGILYKNLNSYEKALEYYSLSRSSYEEVNDLDGLSKTVNNIGNLFRIQGELETAVNYFRQSIELKEILEDSYGLSISYNNLAWVFLELEQYDSAFFYQRKSLSLRENDNITGRVHSLNSLAVIHQKHGNYDSSIFYAEKAMNIMGEFKPFIELSKVTQTLYETYKLQDNFEKALYFLEQNKTTNDSLYNTEKTLATAAIENDLMLAKKDFEITKEKLVGESQKKFIYYLTSGLFIALIFIIIIIRIRLKEKRANKELQLSYNKISTQSEELQKLNTTKDRLFAIIGHDMRSPINSLKNLLDLLQDKILSPDDFISLSEKLRVGVDSVHFTLNNMLLWANGQMRGIVAKPVNFPVRQLANECLELFTDVVHNKEITTENKIEDENVAFADSNQIRVVIRNLLSNAIKYTPHGGSIAISCTAAENLLEIAVTDSGIGIAESVKADIFHLPINKGAMGTDNEKGTGIGLMLCKDFVTGNGGKIWAESEPEKGSSFHFTLPMGGN